MRYKGRGNPLAVLVSCLTLGFLPTILLILGIIWIINIIVSFVETIPVWLWIAIAIAGFMMFIVKTFKEGGKDD